MNLETKLQLERVVQAFRDVYENMPLPMILVFLEVCQNKKGLTVNDVRHRVGLTQSSASRHCRGLTRRQTPTRDGVDLCKFVNDPADFRSKRLILNEKGKALYNKITSIFEN
jgi:DNA-binding MarR family transcriptional regulator